jgi:alcohol dehydrogenase class IV
VNHAAKAEEGVAWVQALCTELEVPPLSVYGLEREAFPRIIEATQRASSFKGNPIVLTGEELTAILEAAL